MMSDNYKKIISELASLTGLNFFVAGISYVFTIVIANTLGPNDFGTYSYIMLWGGFAMLLIVFSTEATIPAQYAKTNDKQGLFNLTQTIKILFFFIWIASIPLWYILTELGLVISKNPGVIIGLITLTLASFRVTEFYEISRNNIRFAKIYLLERMFYLFLLGFFLYTNSLDIVTIFSCLFVATVCSLLLQIKDNFNLIKRFEIENFQNVFGLFKENLPLVIIQFSTFVYGGFSRVILESKFGMEELGIYSAGWQIILVGTIFQSQVIKVWRSRISHAIINDISQLKQLLKSYFFFSTLPVAIFAILINIFSYDIVNIVFNKEYLPVHKLLPIFSFYFIVINLDSLTTILWISINKRTEILKISLTFTTILMVVLYNLSENSSLEFFASMVVFTHFSSVIFLLIRFYLKYLNKLYK